MSVRVRFAPSPTGRLHVGNVRTALINWLFAKKAGGIFLLRIDDTDTIRSTKAYEDGLKADLQWLGMQWNETFNQSGRFAKYDAAVDMLKANDLLYPCYETPEELDRKRKLARAQGKPPIYDRAALKLSSAQKQAYEVEGRLPHWRFKLSGERAEWIDLVRGPQSIDTTSVSDPILIRADGSYLYTLPSVVDDIEYNITHIVRGEDHVTNSGTQIEIFKALGAKSPEMAHTPLLIGADGQGLSKRLGSLAIADMRDKQAIEPQAIVSLLARIGTSEAVKLEMYADNLIAGFDFGKFGRAPARFDEAELRALNADVIHNIPYNDIKERLLELASKKNISAISEDFWMAIRANLVTLFEANIWLDIIYGDIVADIPKDDQSYLHEAVALLPDGKLDNESWQQWTGALKTQTGRKGKALFMPLRLALTGQNHGPEMDAILALIGREKALARLQAVSG